MNKTTALLATASLAGSAFAASARPNVVLVLADDLGFGDVGWTGRNVRNSDLPRIHTPNLDRLAAEGRILTDHYCAAPVCAPSRASLLTGMRQGRCSVSDNNFDAPIRETRTLGSVLHDAGYVTAAIGKWGVGGGGGTRTQPVVAHPLDRGFDYFFGFPFHVAGHTYYHYDEELNGVWMGILENRKNATESAKHIYSTDLFTARAKAFISERAAAKDGKPFFLYFAVNAVHGSGQLAGNIPMRETLHVPGRPYPAEGVTWPLEPEDPYSCNTWIDPRYAGLPKYAARYATTISRFDEAMGDLMRHLDKLGLSSNTVLVVTSDNGPAGEYGADTRNFASAGPFDGMKRDVFEGGMRVPTFVRWPGKLKPGTDSTPSASYDWLATLADLAGTPEASRGTDGVSLLPRWGLSSAEARPSLVYSQYDGPSWGGEDFKAIQARKRPIRGLQQMMRDGDYVALRTQMSGTSTPIRLYDVVRDPFQERDLAKDPAQAERVAAMKAALDRMFVDPPKPVPFGKAPNGEQCHLYSLVGRGGLEIDFSDWGGRVVGIRVPTAGGAKTDVTLGFDAPPGWATNAFYAGALIGRYANRIGNGRFALDGKDYALACNNTPGGIPCNLHGGVRGWSDRLWKVQTFTRDDTVGAVLSRVSEDGEEGFPGRMHVEVVYTVLPDNTWRIEYAADTDKPTPCNPTHHVFFNMNGKGTILEQELFIDADRYSELDAGLIPTGRALDVSGTCFDFRKFRPVGKRSDGDGFNDNMILNGSGFRRVAALRGTAGTVEVWTDQPGLELYSGGKFRDGCPTKNGGKLERFGYLALETQHFPDSPNHPEFPSTILRPGELFSSRTEYRFRP